MQLYSVFHALSNGVVFIDFTQSRKFASVDMENRPIQFLTIYPFLHFLHHLSPFLYLPRHPSLSPFCTVSLSISSVYRCPFPSILLTVLLTPVPSLYCCIFIKISKKSSLSALRNSPLGPSDALFLSRRTRRGVSSEYLIYLHKREKAFFLF